MINQVRDAKIKFLGTLKQGNDEEKLEWKDLVTQLKVIFFTQLKYIFYSCCILPPR